MLTQALHFFIDYWLNAQRDFDKLSGMSVAIVQDQIFIFKKGYDYESITIAINNRNFARCFVSSKFFSWKTGDSSH